jgi:hypothetical protein
MARLRGTANVSEVIGESPRPPESKEVGDCPRSCLENFGYGSQNPHLKNACKNFGTEITQQSLKLEKRRYPNWRHRGTPE